MANDPAGYIDFAVSRTADPTGSWDIGYIFWEGYLPDSAAFGTSTDKLAVGSNLYAMPANDT